MCFLHLFFNHWSEVEATLIAPKGMGYREQAPQVMEGPRYWQGDEAIQGLTSHQPVTGQGRAVGAWGPGHLGLR